LKNTLRIALSLEKKAPLKYVQFLEATTKARILEKDGGQWRFRHQLLQDYFAQLYEKNDESTNSKELKAPSGEKT